MKVPKNLARDIVESLKEVINQDINYIDNNSIIIASTNESRIGTFHGGAKRVLMTQKEEIISFDGQYEGTKQGINLPVYFENNIVGVIGITGSEEEVGKYGKIIKQMTEILIKEAYLVEQEKISRESRKQFVEELLFLIHKEDEKTLKMRSELLNIKIDIPRTVIVGRIYEDHTNNSLSSPLIHEKIYNFIKTYIDFNIQNIIVQSGMNYIIILDINTLKDISNLVKSIRGNIESKYKAKICFGIGSSSKNADEIRKSYVEAKKALNVALVSKDKYIVQYSELDIELLIDEIPKDTRSKFVDKIFNNINSSQIDMYVDILIKYFENNGSITKVADELFIHKNTLQYRLNKVKQLTGYDPRIISELVILYLAVLIYKTDK